MPYLLLSAAEPQIVKVAAFNYYPGIFMDKDGAVKGFFVDTLTEIGRLENIRFLYVWGSWSEGLARIRSGEVDILTSTAYTSERALYMDYGKIPLLTVWSELYVPVKSGITSITNINRKKIAVMKDDFNARSFIELAEKFHVEITILEVPSFDEVFNAVAANKADAGVVNCTFGVAKHREYGLRTTGIVFNPFDIFFTAAKDKNKDLLKILDSYLNRWIYQESSVYNLSRQKWTYGNVGAIRFVPPWFLYLLAGLGFLVLFFLAFTVILRLKVTQATHTVQQREQKLRSYIDNSPYGVFVVDEKGKYLEVNHAATSITGYSESELLTMSIIDLQPRETAEADMEYFQKLKDTGSLSIELEFLRKDGAKRWWSVSGVKLNETRFLGFAQDITDRKLTEQTNRNLLNEKELFLKEVHHRIKNNMNTIKGLLTLQIFNLKDPVCMVPLKDAESRVQSMIVLYDKLYCSQNYRELSVRDYIQGLAEEIVYNFPNNSIVQVNTLIEDFILNVKLLAPLGIIVNEVITNIMKHAFMGRDSGIITITASLAENLAVLRIHDNGIGLPEEVDLVTHTGFGLTLIKLLTEQIDGKLTIERREGTSIILEFEVSD
jgi:PAS domain S-box-containing protein